MGSETMLDLMTDVFSHCRSITGDGVRKTLRAVQGVIPDLEIREVASGSDAFDWTVPNEWNVNAAYIVGPTGERVVDFADSPLHVVSYSVPFRGEMTLAELDTHLHSDPAQPDAVPYRTSYYEPTWGFCLTDSVRSGLKEGTYQVVMDTTLEPGSLTYGELLLPGRIEDEILISTHICHPAQANDNLAGMAVATEVAAALDGRSNKYGYRVLFLPGGIGSLVWLSQNEEGVARVKHALTLACLGDDAGFTYKSTFDGIAPIDLAAKAVLGENAVYEPFQPYGFDERNYTSPAFRIDAASLSRSPHGGYPEYHSSLDDMSIMSGDRLAESRDTVLAILERLDEGTRYRNVVGKGEPQLGRRGLYGSIGGLKSRRENEMALLWALSMSDGRYSDLDIAARSGLAVETVRRAVASLVDAGLLELVA